MRRRSLLRLVAAGAAVLAVGSPGAAVAAAPEGEPISTASEVLRFEGVVPGSERSWTISLQNTSASPAEVAVTVEGSGPLHEALRWSIELCSEPWADTPAAHCDGERTDLVSDAQVAADPVQVPAPALDPGEGWYGRFRVALPLSTDNRYQAATAELRSTVSASERSPVPTSTTSIPTTSLPAISDLDPTPPSSPSPTGPSPGAPASRPPVLPFTGAGPWNLVGLGSVLIVVGLVVRLRSRRGGGR